MEREGGTIEDAEDLLAVWRRLEADWQPNVDAMRVEASRQRCT